MVYVELGRFPLYITRKLRILKYWLKVRQSNNCILQSCYDYMVENNDSWAVNIKQELQALGLGQMWYELILDVKSAYKIIEERIYDTEKQNMLAKLSNSNKCILYQHLIDNVCLQYYLTKPINHVFKRYITMFRISAHKLSIEKGRHSGIARDNRLCKCCSRNDIEDEYHFILVCPCYLDLRQKLIKKFYFYKPSVFKLVKLLSINNVKELCRLGKFLQQASILRNELLSIN